MLNHRLLLAVPFAAAASCSGDPPTGTSPEASPVRTDSLIYVLRHANGLFDAWAVATYRNGTGANVYYAQRMPGAPEVAIRRAGPDSLRPSVVRGLQAGVGGVPTGVVPPGGVLTERVWLGSAESPGASPPIAVEERAGHFRLYFTFCREPVADSDRCVPLPREASQSNVFEVRL